MDSLAETENSKDEKIQVGSKILQKAKILWQKIEKTLCFQDMNLWFFFFNLDSWIKKEANKM